MLRRPFCSLTSRLVSISICSMGLIGCEAASQARGVSPPATYPYRVVTTTAMVTDMVAAVAGPYADLHALIGSGVDPHLYKPTRNDIAELMEADVVCYSGLNLEGKMTVALARLAESGRRVVAVTEQLDEAYVQRPADFEGHPDPHVWMDASAWSRAVGVVADALVAYDPPHAAEYRTRAAAYQRELADLDEYAARVIATIPEPQRLLITAHDAFNYFGRRYGIRVLGIQGLSTESEAGLDDINRLVDLIVAQHVPAVFVETSVADKNVRALLEGAQARGLSVSVGGSLFSDAMGATGTYEGTYIGMIDHNATIIARALGGKAPPRGLHGKLTPIAE